MSSPAAATPMAFNPYDPAFLNDPFPFYRAARQERPVAHFAAVNLFAAFRYEDCVAILKDHASWSSARPAADEPEPSMLGSDPPRHQRLRSLVSQAFTPKMVDQLEPRIREIAHELLAPHAGGGELDFVDALAYPLPVIVISEILGVPSEDRAQFKEWSDAVVATLGSGIGQGGRELPAGVIEDLTAYFARMVELRRAEPKNDLITGLVRAEEAGERLNFTELMQMLILLLVAGNETTTNLIGNAALEFMEHPGELARLRAEPSLMPTAIEEVMRYSSPVQATVRRAMRDIALGDKSVPAGQQCIVFLASANRDETQFPDAERFDIGRTPNRHIGFGQGIHFCLGAPLARLEASVALEVFLQKFSGLERTTTGALPRVPTFIMHGARELPMRVTPH